MQLTLERAAPAVEEPGQRTHAGEVRVHEGQALIDHIERLAGYSAGRGPAPLSRHPRWLAVLRDGLGHTPYCIEAVEAGMTRGFLPLAHVRSVLFGRFLVSLPYLNYGGPVADDDRTAEQLVGRAVELARQLDVRYLELRDEQTIDHAAITQTRTDKVHMRLELPATAGPLWDGLHSKVRNQVRKGQKSELAVAWGGEALLSEFYDVFAQNMRDLGTPVYGRDLFRSVLRHFPDQAEFCVVRAGSDAVAAALLLHGFGVTEVPSASALRSHNHTCANMLMYWRLLERAVERGQSVFDFGRSSSESNTYRFKKQWGAEPHAAVWQYHVRRGSANEMRPDSPRYQRRIRTWQRLPVWLTRLIGPAIVRGIP